MIIYIDILLFINTILNYAILMTTEKLMKRDCRLYRILLGAATGAAFSLIIFIDSDNRVYLFLLRILCTFLCTFLTFGWRSGREFFKVFLCNTAVCTLYCGAYILFYQVFKPPNMIIVNDVVYLQINPLWLTALTGVIYLLILGIYKIFSERIKSTVVPLQFRVQSEDYHCIGKIDTGCNLREPFSSAPVIIADSSVFTASESLPRRVIPYTAVGGSSYLCAVKAESVYINKKNIDGAIYIASADLRHPHYQAIINADIMR